jgi:hypothetical protein
MPNIYWAQTDQLVHFANACLTRRCGNPLAVRCAIQGKTFARERRLLVYRAANPRMSFDYRYRLTAAKYRCTGLSADKSNQFASTTTLARQML